MTHSSNRIFLAIGQGRPFHVKVREQGHRLCLITFKADLWESDVKNYDMIIALDDQSTPDDWARVCKDLDQVYDFAQVFCLNEKCSDHYMSIVRELGKGFTSSSAFALTTDKAALRELLSRREIDHVRFCVVRQANELSEACAKVDFPCILKPLFGRGSSNIFRIESQENLDGLRAILEPKLLVEPFIVEQWLEGDEYSVEAISEGGQHKVIGITKKFVNQDFFIEVGHCFPAPDLSIQQIERVRLFIENLLDAIELDRGISHTEIKIKGDIVHLVETHTRAGGGRITDLVKFASGVDLVSLGSRQIAGETIDLDALDSMNKDNHAVIQFYLPDDEFEVKSVAWTEQEGVREKALSIASGQRVRKGRSNADRLAHAIAVDRDPLAALSRARSAIANIEIIKA